MFTILNSIHHVKKNFQRILADRVHDFGPSGLSFESTEAFEEGSRLDLVIVIPKKVRCTAVVSNMRKLEAGYLLGAQISKLSEEDRHFLRPSHLLEVAETTLLDAAATTAERLKSMRNLLGLSLDELSNLSGVPIEDISNIEDGTERNPRRDVMHSPARGLSVPLSSIIEVPPALLIAFCLSRCPMHVIDPGSLTASGRV